MSVISKISNIGVKLCRPFFCIQVFFSNHARQRPNCRTGAIVFILFSYVGCVFRLLIIINNLKTANDKFEENILEQKNLMEEQKLVVEEKQKEILDSIYYARRIQRSLITNEKYIEKHLDRLNIEENTKNKTA